MHIYGLGWSEAKPWVFLMNYVSLKGAGKFSIFNFDIPLD